MNEIEQIEEYFGCTLPKTYREFLLLFTEEMKEDIYLYLPELMIERNECYETKKYAPGYITIGDDGGGMAFILELDRQDPEVSIVGHGSMDPKFKDLVCVSFSKWLASDFEYDAE